MSWKYQKSACNMGQSHIVVTRWVDNGYFTADTVNINCSEWRVAYKPFTKCCKLKHSCQHCRKVQDYTVKLTLYVVDMWCACVCVTVCRSCIVGYLTTENCCPLCGQLVHKTKPLDYICADQILQDLAYKLIPSLYTSKKLHKFREAKPFIIRLHRILLLMFAVSVCQSRGSTRLRSAKTAEQIKILFGVNTPGSQKNVVLDESPDLPQRGEGSPMQLPLWRLFSSVPDTVSWLCDRQTDRRSCDSSNGLELFYARAKIVFAVCAVKIKAGCSPAAECCRVGPKRHVFGIWDHGALWL